MVHKIELGKNTDCALASGIDMAGELERFGVDDIHVRRRNSKNDAVGLCNVLGDQVTRLLLNIRRLVTDWHLGKTWQVDQRQAQHVRRVDLEVYRLSVDALVRASDSVGLVLNLPLDFLEVVEAAAWNVVELSPFFLASNRFGSVRDVDGVIFGFVVACGGDVDELQYERSTCYDAAATGEEVLADNVFED